MTDAAWASFDAAWYLSQNPAAAAAASPRDHYRETGAADGLSPNRWFDEAFYRARNPDVAAQIEAGRLASGFAHYATTGYPDRAPHWLFDPAAYRAANPGLTTETLAAAGFRNAYDHYLKFGAAEGRTAHPFLDPAVYRAALGPADRAACAATSAFHHFLGRPWPTAEPRTAAGFDPAAYRAANPRAAAEIERGLWHSAQHHALAAGSAAGGTAAQAPATIPLIKINIDRPALRHGAAIEPLGSHLDIVGWAAANHPIAAVEIFIDGKPAGRAHHGLRTEGVLAAFPALTHGGRAGFRFIGPAPANPGQHRIRVTARGDSGLETTVEFDAIFTHDTGGEDYPGALRRRIPLGETLHKRALLARAGLAPLFTIILQTDPPPSPAATALTLASLSRQTWPHWHLADAAAPASHPDRWLVRLTPGTELAPHALLEFALHRLTAPTQNGPATDFLYADERRPDPTSTDPQPVPFFKPGWSPDLLLATPYIGQPWAAAAALPDRAALSPHDLTTASNTDLVLRLTEHAAHIAHLPQMLAETRAETRAETAPETHAQTQAQTRTALQHALDRRRIPATLEPTAIPGTWRLRHHLPHPLPLISVIIPTAARDHLIDAALQTLLAPGAYPNLQIIVIDTAPDAPAAAKAAFRQHADLVIADATPFNWSRLNNRAAAHAQGDLLLFLNDDIATPPNNPTPDWLHTMAGHALRPETGAVGPLLLYPPQPGAPGPLQNPGPVQHPSLIQHAGLIQHPALIQHAGLATTPSGAQHLFHGLPATDPGPFGIALTTRNVSAVTGACLLTRRDTFDQLGGFDERLDITANDTDYCLRCQQAGLLVVFTPHAILTHHESATRAGLPEAHNDALFRTLHPRRLARPDPYLNPRLSRSQAAHPPDPEPLELLYPARPLADPDTIRRILVIKLDQLGDFLLALPAIRRLHAGLPHARLTALISPALCPLAGREPAIHDTIPFDLAAGDPLALAATLRRRRFDLAIDLRCHPETRPILQACSATWRAGFDPARDFPWLDIAAAMEPDTAGTPKRTPMADTLLDFAARIAAHFTPATTTAAEAPAPRTRAPWPATIPAPPANPRLRIAIHPGAGAPIKRWPLAHFATLIHTLADAHDCWITLVGTPEETPLADALLAALAPGTPAASAAGLTTLPALAALLAAHDLFIGNDSGPAHLAASLGVPTLSLHAGVTDAREWAPRSPAACPSTAIALRRRMTCSPCYLATPADCPRALACLTELPPHAVAQAALLLLAGRETA